MGVKLGAAVKNVKSGSQICVNLFDDHGQKQAYVQLSHGDVCAILQYMRTVHNKRRSSSERDHHVRFWHLLASTCV